MSQYFSPFVLPFCAAVLVLLGICIWKYVRWYKHFDRLQKAIFFFFLISWKFIPALWEAFREGIFHVRISRKNLVLGYMHLSIALGWFMLIVVGAIASHM